MDKSAKIMIMSQKTERENTEILVSPDTSFPGNGKMKGEAGELEF